MHGFTITCNDYGLGQYTQASGNGEHPEMDGEIVSSAWKHAAVYIDGASVANLPEDQVEDHISALTTKDENKLKVYLQNYDGHCLRACTYFEETMPDIVEKREEIAKEGQTYKVVYSDGSVEYLNEFNPNLLKALQELKGK